MIEQFPDIKRFDQIRSDWESLYQSSGTDNLFLTATWIENWIRWFSSQDHMVLLNHIDQRWVSAGIFHRDRKRYSFIPTTHSSRPWILANPNIVPLFRPYLDYMRSTGRGIRVLLPDMSDSVSLFQRLKQETSDKYYLIRRNPHCTRHIVLAGSMKSYLQTRASNVRTELQRKLRKMEKTLPQVRLTVYDTTSDMSTAFSKIDEVERDSWKFHEGSSIVCSPNETGFYREVLCFKRPDIQGRAFLLEHGDTPLAFVIGVIHRQRFYALKTSYQKKYAALTPGQMLFYRLIEYFYEVGSVKEIELLGSDSRWKRELATGERGFCDVEIVEKSIFSHIDVVAKQHLRPFLQSVVKRYPHAESIKNKAKNVTNRLVKSKKPC